MSTLLTEDERESARSTLVRAIADLENISKPTPATEQQIVLQVVEWEKKLHNTCRGHRMEYLDKVRNKRLRIEEELNKYTNQPLVLPPPRAQVVVARSAPTSTTSEAAAAAAAMASGPPTAEMIADKKLLDTLREPLEMRRSVLRLINAFGFKRSEQKWKEEFMQTFQDTTNVIKSHKTGRLRGADLTRRVDELIRRLNDMGAKTDKRVKEILAELEVDTVEEAFAMEIAPFGIIERLTDLGKFDKYKDRLKQASGIIGSEDSIGVNAEEMAQMRRKKVEAFLQKD